MASMKKRTLPNGTCFCGCGGETSLGKFFLPGHDRWAEAALVKNLYGSVVGLLEHHGYGPGGKNLRREMGGLVVGEPEKEHAR